MAESSGIPDRRAREQALDPAGSYIVQAPAGSGKTELLAQRYLRLLVQVESPEEIIAITFTNKAAAEMRGRILDALRRAQTEPRPPMPHQAQTWELARQVLEHDQAHGWQITVNPRRLRVQTIDSLCAGLTRQMPWLSGFGAQPAVTDDAVDIYREAAQNTLAELEKRRGWSRPVQELLCHLDNDIGRVEGLLAEMLARRDQWLRHVTDRVRREELEAALGRAIRSALEKIHVSLAAGPVEELTALARYAAGNLRAEGGEGPVLTCLDLTALPAPEPASLSLWLGLAELLVTRSGDWRKAVNVGLGFPAPSQVGDPEDKKRRQEMKQRHKVLTGILSSDASLAGRLHGLRELPPVCYDEDQWRILSALFELLPMAAAQLELVFRERGEVDFAEVSRAALVALGRSEEPTELALSLDYRIQHLLVDEFQDTSLGQHELLARLTAGWEPGDGRTLFVVGDPMQSIYRFREAEVGLFLRSRMQGLGDVALQSLTLKANFRSQGAMVAWVNEAFRQVLPAAEDIGDGAVSYADSAPVRPALEGDAVQIHPFLGKDSVAEAGKVVELVREAQRSFPEGTVAVLVRSRSHLSGIVASLRKAGLRFQAVDIEPLGERQVVQDLVALTRALLHPADRLAWLAVLRAPWCGLGLADLYALAGKDHRRTVHDLIGDKRITGGLSEDGRVRLRRLRNALEQSLGERRRLPLRRWVEGTWLALGGPACLSEETDLLDARVFLEKLDALDVGGDLDEPAQLAERLYDLYAQPDLLADERLQIMTVHKAKGLEFDTVIVPGLGNRPRSPDTRLLMWLERPRGEGSDSELLLAPIKPSDREEDRIYRHIARLDRDKGLYEDGRLLYVAATRARRRLHLLGHTGFRVKEGAVELCAPEAGSLLHQLWPVVAGDFLAAADVLPGQEGPGGGDDIEGAKPVPEGGIRRLPSDWVLPRVPPAAPWHGSELPETESGDAQVEFLWARETIRHVGTVVHHLLQQIGRHGFGDWEAARIGALRPACRVALASLGVPPAQLEPAVERVLRALQQTLADPRGRWILNSRHRQARCEYPLTGLVDGRLVHVVLDRCFVDRTGAGWIIDYKTSAHEGADLGEFLDNEQLRYRQQLERYAVLMNAQDARPWRLGLYFPLLKGWREWPADV